MSLRFDVSKIENYDENYKVEVDGSLRWHTVTQAIVFNLIPCGMGDITEKNWKEVYRRIYVWEHACGALQIGTNKETGESEHIFLTAEDVRNHIGLTTNVYPEITKAAFAKKVVEFFDYDVRNSIQELE